MPPRSTPMTRWALTGRGYHTRPDGGRRKALPGLQGRQGQGEGADRAPPGTAAARRGPSARSRRGRPRWRRRIGLGALPAPRAPRRLDRRELPLVPRPASTTRTHGCRRPSRRASRRRTERSTSKPSLILLLGTDGDKTAARSDARRSDSILLVRTDPEPAPAGVPLDPARPARRHPGPRHVQDQRRLPARRAGADAEDGPRAHRPAAEPRRPGRLRRLPHRDRRARRRRDRRAEADPVEPVRLPVRDRRTLPAVAGLALREGEAEDERPAGADLLPRPREPARPVRERPHARRAPAGRGRGDDRQARRARARS